MENAPRKIPGIVWEQFSRQPRNDVSFPLLYKSTEVAGPQQTASALPRDSTSLKEPLRAETTSKQTDRAREYLRTPLKTDFTYFFFYNRVQDSSFKNFIQDADAFCCRYLPWKPQLGELFLLSSRNKSCYVIFVQLEEEPLV